MTTGARPRAGAGDVVIRLVRLDDGEYEEFVLRPSYNAARGVSMQAGGIMKMMQRIVDGDIEAAVVVVTLGMGYGSPANRGPRDLAERVWATGLSDESGGLGERCITYLRVLMGGGRLPPADEQEEGAEDGSGGPPPAA